MLRNECCAEKLLAGAKAVTLGSANGSWTYDTTAHTKHELSGVDGFVAGETISTNWTGTITDVGDCDNEYTIVWNGTAKESNYALTTNYGTLTVTPAPTKPWQPTNPDDPTDLTPPSDPDPSGPYHAWVGAQNIVKCYDGLGTNVVAKFGPDALDPTIRYSLNGTDFVTWDELQLTNVCAATKIYFSFEKDNYTTITNYAWVTITQRVATITFTAANKVFDNTTAATCTATNFANVVSGEDFTLDTSSMSFAFDTAAVGSGKTVTATGYSDDKVAATGDTLKSNYSFNFIDTTTASITKESIEIGGKGPFNNENPPPAPPAKDDDSENDSGVKNVIKTYDGEGTNIIVNVTKPTTGSEVVYSVDGGVTYLPVGTAPSFTNVVDGTQVWYVVSAPGCDPVTNYAWVTIHPKAVTVTADPKSKVYGAADPELTAQVAGTLGTDTVAYSLSRASGEDVADSPYTITASGDALQGNYSVTYTPGEFTITKKPVNDPLNPGDPAPGTGLDFGGEGKDKVPYKGTEWEPEVSVTNEIGTLTSSDFEVTYFDNIDSTNKAGIVITGKGNYSGVFTNYFEITKLEVKITADNKNIVYGSAVPATSFYTFKGEGFTNGETIAILTVQPTFGSAYSTTTPVGPIAITKKTDAEARNYTFIYVNGTLSVTKDSIKIGGKGPFNDENPPPAPPAKDDDSPNESGVRNVIKTYDGIGTNIIVEVTYPTSEYAVYYSTDGGNTWGGEPSFTNVVDGTQVWYKVEAPGCDTVTNYAWVTIHQKGVTITSANGNFTYTGYAQSNATANAVGFVAGEGATYDDFKTIVKVSESGADNTFAYTLKDNTLAGNYLITVVKGTLTMKPADIEKVPPKDSSDPSDPTPPTGDGPWTGANNIVKVFDNTGTNIIAKFANLMPPELQPNVVYTTNASDSASWKVWDELQFTNVCTALEVFYRVTDANYNTLTNSAFVTITAAKQEGVRSEAYSNDYDSVEHSIQVEPDGGITEYYVDGGWTDEKPMYKDAVETNVIFRVKKPNYEDFIGTNSVTITKRQLTLTSASATKVYDGAALTTNKVEVTAGSFAGEEDFTSNCTGSQTLAGSTKNTFNYELTHGTKWSNYAITLVEGVLTVTKCPIGPDPSDPTKPIPGFVVPPIDPLTYDGQPQEPEVVVTNTVVVGGPKELVLGTDYTVEYFNNTNATEEAYVVITGIGNYGGCYTNYFTILPREMTLKSGTKTMYLTNDVDSVVCSNGLVWVVLGSFVKNAGTQEFDGFEATVPSYLEGNAPVGPRPNDFTVIVKPGLETNYCFTLIPGELAIYSTPTNAQEEIHEEIPSPKGGIIDVVMDNNDAGKYAADKPQELNDEAKLLDKGPTDKVEFRMVLSTNCVEESYGEVTNKIVEAAIGAGKSAKEYNSYIYEKIDIAVEKIHAHCDTEGYIINVETNDWGNKVSQLLTVKIPYTFNPKLIDFSVWRNHTNDSAGVSHDGVTELGMGVPKPGQVEWYETNSTEVVLHVQKFSVYVFKSLYLSTPLLTGKMQWKYFQADNAFFGGLDIVCTNGDQTAIRNLSYIYEDRDNRYLRCVNGAAKLSTVSGEVIGGKTFGKVVLDPTALQASALFTTNRYGVTDATLASSVHVVSNVSEWVIALATKDIPDLATNKVSAAVEETLGYLTWQEDGDTTHTYWCALGKNLQPLDELAASGQSTPPLTLAAANRMVGYGLPPTTLDSDPSLELVAFNVGGGEVSGKVATVAGDVRGIPGPNARLEVLGASTLGGEYVEVATPQLAADGSFSFAVPVGKTFFKVRLVLVEVIK